MLQQGGFAATDAKGTITLGGGGVPGTIAASMNALFGNAPSFVPMSVDLVTPPVPVVPCAH